MCAVSWALLLLTAISTGSLSNTTVLGHCIFSTGRGESGPSQVRAWWSEFGSILFLVVGGIIPCLSSNLGLSSFGCSGSFSKVGEVGLVGIVPILVKAVDFVRKSESALIPFLGPSISDNAMLFDAFSRMVGC